MQEMQVVCAIAPPPQPDGGGGISTMVQDRRLLLPGPGEQRGRLSEALPYGLVTTETGE
jgi:hypothetical protein